MKKIFKFEPEKDLIVVLMSLAWMWFAYYGTEKLFGDNIPFTMFVSVPLTMIGCCIVLPLWWVVVHKKEGLAGLGITNKRIIAAFICSVLLAAWRFLELRQFIGNENLIGNMLFNGLAIWEVMFIFGWMFTRFERSFGKLSAIVLTAISVGAYHLGTLSVHAIIQLVIVILVCATFYAFTENIFMFWPVYWTIGCTASTMSSDMAFDNDIIIMSAIILAIQIVIIFCFGCKAAKSNRIEN